MQAVAVAKHGERIGAGNHVVLDAALGKGGTGCFRHMRQNVTQVQRLPLQLARTHIIENVLDQPIDPPHLFQNEADQPVFGRR